MKVTQELIEEKHKVKITGTTLKNMPFGVLKEVAKDLGLKYVAVKREVCETNIAAYFGVTLDSPVAPVISEKPVIKDEPKTEVESIDEDFKSIDHVRTSKDFFMFKRFLQKHDEFKPGMNTQDVKQAAIKLFTKLSGVAAEKSVEAKMEEVAVKHSKKTLEDYIKVKEKVSALKPIEEIQKEEKVIPKQFEKMQLVNGVKYGHQPKGLIDVEKLNALTLTPEEKTIFEKDDIRDSDKVRELVNCGSTLKVQEIADVLIRSYAMVYEIRKKFILGKNKKDKLKYTGKIFETESAKEIKEIRLKGK